MNQYAALSQLQANQNQNALAQYQLAAAQRADEATNVQNQLYAKYYDAKTGKVNQSGLLAELAQNPNAAGLIPKLQAQFTEQQHKENVNAKTIAEAKQKQIEIQKEKFANLAFNPSDENVKAHLQDSVLNNELSQQAAEQLFAKVANLNPAQRSEFFREMGMKAVEVTQTRETKRSHLENEKVAKGNLAVNQAQLGVSQSNLALSREKFEKEKNIGTIPAGYRLSADGKSLEAMPGGPTTVALPPKEIQAREAKYAVATTAIKTVEAKADKLIEDIETLRKHPGLSSITGVIGGRTPSISKEGRAAQALFDSIIARGGFQELQDMRKSSPTGGALGNVSNTEGQQLKDAFGALNRTQDASDLRKQLGRVAEDVRGSKTRIREAYDTTYEYRANAGTNTSNIDALLEKYNK
jgi:hypothetical protein